MLLVEHGLAVTIDSLHCVPMPVFVHDLLAVCVERGRLDAQLALASLVVDREAGHDAYHGSGHDLAHGDAFFDDCVH